MNKLRMMSVLITLAMAFSIAKFSPVAAACDIGLPAVGTDKTDYGAFDTATISGSGFGCGEVLSVKVTAPDGSVLAGDGTGSPATDVVTTDSNGEFTLSYALSGTISGSPTSVADGAYAGQSGTYTIEVISADGAVLASTTFTDQSQLGQPVPASVIVTYNGLEWVWASPCALNGCTSGILIGKDGFNYATQAQWALRPPPSAFFYSKCASPWFDLTYNHCDWGDPTYNGGIVSGYGTFGSAPYGGLPAGPNGLYPMHPAGETWLVRVPNAPPTADAGGPYAGNEGSAIALSVASASDPDGDPLTYAWSVNSALCSFSNANVLNPNLTCTDNGNFTATLTVSDGVNPPVSSGTNVTVNNVAPNITADNGTVTADEGQTATNAGSYSDVPADTVSLSVDVGSLVDNGDGTWSWSFISTDGPNESGLVTITAQDEDGGTTTVSFNLTINNVAPTIAISGASNVDEGSPYSLTLGAVTDPGTDTVAFYLVHWGDGNSDSYSSNGIKAHTYADGPNSYAITVDLTDEDGTFLDRANALSITVNNVAPTASLGNDGPINEGGSAVVSFSGASDPSSDDTLAGFHYAFDCNGGSLAAATYAGSSVSASTSCGFADNGSYTVSGKIMDKDGGSNEYTTVVTVNNVAPTLGVISVDPALVPVGTSINASADFTDPGTLDTHTGLWSWGDTATSAGSITETGGNGTASASHSYTTPGVYTIKLTVTDNDGAASNESVYQYVVVYDPNGGFVTGGGWINSPAGAYAADPSLTGKASFGFVAKYKKGQSTPDGNTEFQFKAGNLNFHSSSYQWLVVAGAKAQFKGEGAINGSGHYGFMLTAIDGQINGGGGVDKFRIKIWDIDNGDTVVYDNLMAGADDADPTTALGGGSIVIHK